MIAAVIAPRIFNLAQAWPGSFNLPSWVAPALASAGIVLGLAIIINQVRTDRRSARRSAPGASTRPADAGPLRDVMRDAEELIDRLAARADEQAQRLETLVNRAALAEQRLIQTLRAEQARAEHHAHAAAAEPSAAPPRQPIADRQPHPEPKPAQRIPARAIAADSPHSDVYELADQGLPSAEIAKRLGAPKGEIELILSLRQM